MIDGDDIVCLGICRLLILRRGDMDRSKKRRDPENKHR